MEKSPRKVTSLSENMPSPDLEKYRLLTNVLQGIKRKLIQRGIKEGEEDPKDLNELMEKIFNFSKRLEGKYPNAKKYLVLHALSGSNKFPEDEIIYDDFPGSDSVVNFVNELFEQYK